MAKYFEYWGPLTFLILLLIAIIFGVHSSIEGGTEARLKWEKQQYLGEIAKTLCHEREICEPLVEFKNKLSKEVTQ